MHKIIVLGPKSCNPRVTKPWTYFEFPTNNDQILDCYFLYFGMLPMHKKVVLGQKCWNARVTKPWNYFESPTNSDQQ